MTQKESKTNKKKRVWKIIARIMAVIAVVFILLTAAAVGTVYMLNKKVTVAPNDCIICSFYGYNSMGKVRISGNYNRFADKYPRIRVNKRKFESYMINNGYSKNEIDSYINDFKAGDYYFFFKMCTEGGLNREEGLYNGESLIYHYDVSKEDIESCFKVNLDRELFHVTVEGLEEIDKYDPFDYVDICYSGIAPYAKISLEKSKLVNEYEYLSFKVNKEDHLSNGDVIVITPSLKCSEEAYVQKYNKLPDLSSKAITVKGLTSWIDESSDITSEMLEMMRETAEDKIKATSLNYADGCSLDKVKFMGYYLLTNKDENVKAHYNKCIMAYKITVQITQYDKKSKKDVTEYFDYYYYVRFEDLLLDAKGNLIDNLSDFESPITSVAYESNIVSEVKGKKTNHYYFVFMGVETIDDLYQSVVADYKSKYQCENKVSVD